MAHKQSPTWLTDEVADFLASCPSREELLAYRPSALVQERGEALLAKSKAGSLSADEVWEWNQFEHVEILMQSVKARLRARRPVPS
jgi:hypothetical protein